MLQITKAQSIIEQELQKLDFFKPKTPNKLYDPVKYILSIGGKRIRPSLVLLACNIFSDEYMHALPTALSLEIFHNFTLLHDDIMDKSDTRRGNPSVHKRWNSNIAILSGDAMSIMAYELLAQTGPPHLQTLLHLFNRVALQVCEGQQYDMDYEEIRKISMEEYLNMIELKTAVLIAGSLKSGAILGGADKEDSELIYEFGRNLGIAFQMQDDYLDVYGDPTKFQKFIGGDIVANKKTCLLVKALEVADSEKHEKLNYLLYEAKISTAEKVRQVKVIYNGLGISQWVNNQINVYFEKSLACLSDIKVEHSRKKEMYLFADKLLKRNN